MSYLLSRRHEQRCKREAQISKVIQLLFAIRALIISVVTYKSREHVRDCNAWNSNKDGNQEYRQQNPSFSMQHQ